MMSRGHEKKKKAVTDSNFAPPLRRVLIESLAGTSLPAVLAVPLFSATAHFIQ